LNRALKEGLEKKFLEKIIATVINPRLFILEPKIGIFATLLWLKHLLSNYTLLNNYRATHLVNNKALLVEESIVKSSLDNAVESGT
jgi:hypothetical protein